MVGAGAPQVEIKAPQHVCGLMRVFLHPSAGMGASATEECLSFFQEGNVYGTLPLLEG